MTETEQLRENTKKQYTIERMTELKQYFDECYERVFEAHKLRDRAYALELLALLAHTIVIGITLWQLPENSLYMNISFLIWILTTFRDWRKLADLGRAAGEYKGMITTLEKLGMLEIQDLTGGGNKKEKVARKSMFPRFKELWERLSSKDKKEQFA